jgi:hypothetical protein
MNVLALEKEIIAIKHTASENTVDILQKIENIGIDIMGLKLFFSLNKIFQKPLSCL